MPTKKKSQFLSAFGKSFQIFKALSDTVLDLGGDDEDIRRILIDESLRISLARAIIDSKLKPSPKTPKLDEAIRKLEDKKEAIEGPRREEAARDDLERERAIDEMIEFSSSDEYRKAILLLKLVGKKKIEAASNTPNSQVRTFMANLSLDKFADRGECLSLIKWWRTSHYYRPLTFLPAIREQIALIADLVQSEQD